MGLDKQRKGRVDRLSLWIGQLSSPGIPRRFVRIPPDIKSKPLVIEGDYSEVSEHRRPPRKGEYVTILDAALVESGLAHEYLRDVIDDDSVTWRSRMEEDLKFITRVR